MMTQFYGKTITNVFLYFIHVLYCRYTKSHVPSGMIHCSSSHPGSGSEVILSWKNQSFLRFRSWELMFWALKYLDSFFLIFYSLIHSLFLPSFVPFPLALFDGYNLPPSFAMYASSKSSHFFWAKIPKSSTPPACAHPGRVKGSLLNYINCFCLLRGLSLSLPRFGLAVAPSLGVFCAAQTHGGNWNEKHGHEDPLWGHQQLLPSRFPNPQQCQLPLCHLCSDWKTQRSKHLIEISSWWPASASKRRRFRGALGASLGVSSTSASREPASVSNAQGQCYPLMLCWCFVASKLEEVNEFIHWYTTMSQLCFD